MDIVPIVLYPVVGYMPYPPPALQHIQGLTGDPWTLVRDLDCYIRDPDSIVVGDCPREIGRGSVGFSLGGGPHGDGEFLLLGSHAYFARFLFRGLVGHHVALVVFEGKVRAHIVSLPISMPEEVKQRWAAVVDQFSYPPNAVFNAP